MLTRFAFYLDDDVGGVQFGELPASVRYTMLLESGASPLWNSAFPLFPLERLGVHHTAHTCAYAIVRLSCGALELHECRDAGAVSNLTIIGMLRRWHVEWFTADHHRFMKTCNTALSIYKKMRRRA